MQKTKQPMTLDELIAWAEEKPEDEPVGQTGEIWRNPISHAHNERDNLEAGQHSWVFGPECYWVPDQKQQALPPVYAFLTDQIDRLLKRHCSRADLLFILRAAHQHYPDD